MKFIVDEMPYFMDECPFYGPPECKLTGDRCLHFDLPCRERPTDECRGLVTLDALMREVSTNE